MVDVRHLAAGGVIAAIAAYVYLSSGGDIFTGGGASTSPGGYVSGDIPASGDGAGGPTYVFPTEVPPTFPAAGTPIDWSAIFGTGSFFSEPEMPVETKKTASVNGGAGSFGPGAGFGGGGTTRTDYLPYQDTGPIGAGAMPLPTASQGGGLLDTLSSYLSSFGRVVTRANPITAASQVGVSMGATVADLFTGGNAPNGGVGGRSGDEVMGSMTGTKKVSNLSGNGSTGAASVNGGGDSFGPGAGFGGAAKNTGSTGGSTTIPMSAEVSKFLNAGVGGAAKKTGSFGGSTIYTHESGARSIVTDGQITGGTSRALDASDIARLPASQRAALGY